MTDNIALALSSPRTSHLQPYRKLQNLSIKTVHKDRLDAMGTR